MLVNSFSICFFPNNTINKQNSQLVLNHLKYIYIYIYIYIYNTYIGDSTKYSIESNHNYIDPLWI